MMNRKKNLHIISFITLLLGILIINTQILFLAFIPSESMDPTINAGNLAIGIRGEIDQINRYDVVVFHYPDDESKYFVKRVIGLPGDTIEIKDGHVYANGIKLKESFTKELSTDNGIYYVPEGCYFMLGDNRNHSKDSRFWKNKYVSKDKIITKVKFILYPRIRRIV